MTAAVVARSAAGPDPRKSFMPEVGCLPLVNLVGTERILVTRLDSRGRPDPQEYYITLSQIGEVPLTGGNGEIVLDAPTISLPFTGGFGHASISTANDGQNEIRFFTDDATTGIYVYSGLLDWTANTANDTGLAYIFSGNVNGTHQSGAAGVGSGDTVDGTSGVAEVYSGATSGTGASGEVDLRTGHATGTGGTGNVIIHSGESTSGTSGAVLISSGNSSGGNSGNIAMQTGSADGSRGIITFDAPIFQAPSGFILDSVAGAIALAASANHADNGPGANVALTGGPGGNTSGDGGGVTILTGTSPHGKSGDFYAASPTNPSGSGSAGIESGDTQGGTGNSGTAFLGTSDAGGRSGEVAIYTGSSHGANQDAGSISLTCGSAHNGNGNGGDVKLAPGNGIGSGRRGLTIVSNLPTADPHVVGALWNSSGVLHVSAG